MQQDHTTIKTGDDVVSFLKDQHERIKRLFGQVLAATGAQRQEAFQQLRRLMAVHETAEEEIVHPAAKRALTDGETIVARRLHEENLAKKELTELEAVDTNTQEFETRLRALLAAVLAHAQAEEREEFAQLAARLEEPRLTRMRKAVELAEAIAPTRPHPGTESAAANLLAGPFLSMIDRARDALS